MISGVLFVLLAEAMLLQSWPVAVWMLLFFTGNAIYLPLFEEKGLERRFGDDYLSTRPGFRDGFRDGFREGEGGVWKTTIGSGTPRKIL